MGLYSKGGCVGGAEGWRRDVCSLVKEAYRRGDCCGLAREALVGP